MRDPAGPPTPPLGSHTVLQGCPVLLRNWWQGLQALQAGPRRSAGRPKTLSRQPHRLLLTLTSRSMLAGETLIPVQLTTAVKGCGRALDPSSDHEDLREGTAVELPLWLLPRFTCENWVHVKCVGLARDISLGASCLGRAYSARDGPSASGMLGP